MWSRQPDLGRTGGRRGSSAGGASPNWCRYLISAETWHSLVHYRDELVDVVRRIGANRADAEDAVHDALIRVVRSGLPHTGNAVLPYLRQASINALRDIHRRAAREDRVWKQAKLTYPGQVEETIVARDLVRRAIARLHATESQRTAAMVLHRMGGASWQDVATVSGVTVSAAQATARRAMVRLAHWARRNV